MLNVGEFGKILEVFTDVTGTDMTYHDMDLLWQLCDLGFAEQWGTFNQSLAGDGTLTVNEMVGGIHALRHMGTTPCPADCWCASVCETGMEGCNCATVNSEPCVHGVDDAQCVATEAKDIFWMIDQKVCKDSSVMPPNPAGTSNPAAPPDNPAAVWGRILLGGIVPALWLLPGICLFLVRRAPTQASTQAASATVDIALNSAGATRGKLTSAAQAAARLRRRVSGTLAQLGWMLLVLAEAPVIFSAIHGDSFFLASAIGHQVYYIALSPWGVALILLSLRPVDARPVTVACALVVALLLVIVFLMINLAISPFTSYWHAPLPMANYVVCSVAYAALAAYAFPSLNVRCGVLGKCLGPPHPTRMQLRRMWLAVRLTSLVTGSYMLVQLFVPLTLGGVPPDTFDFTKLSLGSAFLVNIVSAALVGLVMTPTVRGAILRWLGSLGKSDSREQEAASVAALIASKESVADALTSAEQHFRSCPLSDISLEKLANNKPDPSLYALTSPAKLGGVDGFISHSWSDPGTMKHELLTKWAASIGCGPEGPLMWLECAIGRGRTRLLPTLLVPRAHCLSPLSVQCFYGAPALHSLLPRAPLAASSERLAIISRARSKACIDQENIDANLSSLPVFLAGCKQLVVLAGETYPSRLW